MPGDRSPGTFLSSRLAKAGCGRASSTATKKDEAIAPTIRCWTIPAAACSWVGEAMGSTDFKDLEKTPDKVAQTAQMAASNAAHLAALLKEKPYPG